MKKTFRGLTLAAALLTASGSATADENAKVYDGDGPVTPVAFVGDIPNHSEDAYFAENADAAEQASQAISQAGHTARAAHIQRQRPVAQQYARQNTGQRRINPYPASGQQPMLQQQVPIMQQTALQQPMMGQGVQYAPISDQQMQVASPYVPVEYMQGGGGDVGYGGCDSCGYYGCDSGCDSNCGGKKAAPDFASMFGLCTSDGWCRHEAILWFVENRESPPLVTTAAVGDLPVVGFPTTQTVFGDDIEGDLSVGYRADIGRYVSDNVGIGGSPLVALGEQR